ncbi:porin [Alteromonas portus]|uniref:porin n=1 Tax=Alteromonas portus TaxID=2565549 RepID=UPI003BF7AD0F
MMEKPYSFFAAIFSLLIASTASAEQNELNISGFGTLATATADTRNYQFRTDRSQAEFAKKDGFAFKPLSLIGVQLDYTLSDNLDFVGQFVYREQDEQNIGSITQMAFLRYDISPAWQVRTGRLAADIFHFSDTRDVSIAYPWVKVPTEVYGIVPARSFDGGDISYTTPFSDFNLSVKGFWGSGESDFSSNENSPIKFNDLRSIGVEFTAFDWSVALKHTETKAENDNADVAVVAAAVAQLQPFWIGATKFSEEVSLRNASIHYTSLYFNRFIGDWELSGEFSHIDSNSIALRPSFNGFLNLSYLYGAHTFYALYSFARTDTYFLNEEQPAFPINENTAEIVLFVEEVASTLAHRQQSYSVGWRWDLKENLAFKAQVERTDVKARGTGLRARDGLVVDDEDGVAHTLFLALSFSF